MQTALLFALVAFSTGWRWGYGTRSYISHRRRVECVGAPCSSKLVGPSPFCDTNTIEGHGTGALNVIQQGDANRLGLLREGGGTSQGTDQARTPACVSR